MSRKEKDVIRLERSAKLLTWLAAKSSRNVSLSDKLCRLIVTRATKVSPEDDFLRDPIVDNDLGFDPDELDAFQRGEK